MTKFSESIIWIIVIEVTPDWPAWMHFLQASVAVGFAIEGCVRGWYEVRGRKS